MAYRNDLSEYAKIFAGSLNDVKINYISPEPYCRKYLSYLLDHKEYFLEIYADVLEKVLIHSKKKKEDITLVDFGAGNGLLGIFAKYCGFKKVHINDIDEKFVSAAKELASQLEVNIDTFITGDAASLSSYFNNEKPDAIAGTDVIEHIYHLPSFFEILRSLNPEIVSVFTTASNPSNIIKTRQLRKLQLKDELEGGTPEDSALFGADAHGPYLKIREDIIRSNFKLPEDKLKALAIVTRGFVKKDILAIVNQSIDTGVIPAPIAHPTNTCNPLTGSWTERILTINEYAYIYNNSGFTLNLYLGFYDEHKPLVKKQINKILNTAVRIMGKTFAPYIVLTGSKK